MAARASFSHDSRIVKMPLPKSVLLKDYLLDDLSSCSSNGFRSYPRRQCCTTVRYLIEIDVNKHIKLPPTQKQFLKSKSKQESKSKSKLKLKLKLKSSLVLHKASAAVVDVFKNFRSFGSGSGSGNPRKGHFLPRNLSRKLSKHSFWKRTSEQEKNELKNEPIKQKENILPPALNVSAALTTTAEMKTSASNSNSSTSSDSYFTAASVSSSMINVPANNVEDSEQLAMEKMNTANGGNAVAVTIATATNATGNAKKKTQSEEKNELSPNSVIEFPFDNNHDDEDEVTSPFQHNPLGCKRKLMSKVQRTKSLARLNPVRLEDKITLSESRTHGWILESSLQIQRELAAEKKSIALLQLLKATMCSHDLSKSATTERVLLGFFKERFIEGNVSNYIILQEAKDWINGETKDMFEYQNYNKLTYVKEMEKGIKWLKYNEEERREFVGKLEYEVFTSLVEEMLLEFYL